MIRTLVSYIKSLRLIPHVLVFWFSRHHDLLSYELNAWIKANHLTKNNLRGFLLLMNSLPEYRSLFYFRTGHYWLSMLAKGQNNLHFYMPSDKIGKGLVIWHGFSTVINAESIGEDCQIWQNVTIGKKGPRLEDGRPTIGNRVKICSSAIVIGDIHVSDDATIGAGAVATKDIPSGSIVVAQPSRIL